LQRAVPGGLVPVALGDGDQHGHRELDCRRADHHPADRGHQVLILPDAISRNGQICVLSRERPADPGADP
jgi:hypothetical protein